MNRIIGRFYLKKTSNGNLLGEWSNNHETQVFAESCDVVERGEDAFIGKYISTWQEKAKPVLAKLTIARKPGSSQLFSLEWRGNGFGFDGEGMLCDDILVGDYRQV